MNEEFLQKLAAAVALADQTRRSSHARVNNALIAMKDTRLMCCHSAYSLRRSSEARTQTLHLIATYRLIG